MSNFQNPYQKISWLERRLNALESKLSALTNGASLRSTGGGSTTTGVLETHSHQGTGDGGSLTVARFVEAAAPGTPATGTVYLYAKADGRLYSKDDAGVESGPL